MQRMYRAAIAGLGRPDERSHHTPEQVVGREDRRCPGGREAADAPVGPPLRPAPWDILSELSRWRDILAGDRRRPDRRPRAHTAAGTTARAPRVRHDQPLHRDEMARRAWEN